MQAPNPATSIDDVSDASNTNYNQPRLLIQAVQHMLEQVKAAYDQQRHGRGHQGSLNTLIDSINHILKRTTYDTATTELGNTLILVSAFIWYLHKRESRSLVEKIMSGLKSINLVFKGKQQQPVSLWGLLTSGLNIRFNTNTIKQLPSRPQETASATFLVSQVYEQMLAYRARKGLRRWRYDSVAYERKTAGRSLKSFDDCLNVIKLNGRLSELGIRYRSGSADQNPPDQTQALQASVKNLHDYLGGVLKRLALKSNELQDEPSQGSHLAEEDGRDDDSTSPSLGS